MIQSSSSALFSSVLATALMCLERCRPPAFRNQQSSPLSGCAELSLPLAGAADLLAPHHPDSA